MCSHQVWLVSSIWFLLSTVLVASGRWCRSASSCKVVRTVVFHQAATVLAFSCNCLVSSSPSKVGQFRFECWPLSHKISYRIYHLPCFGRLACHPTLLSAFMPLLTSAWCYQLLWEVGFLPCPHSQPLFLDPCSFTEHSASCPTPVLQGGFSIPPSFTVGVSL
jgi:hypothetical protein